MTEQPVLPAQRSVRRYVLAGLGIVVLLVGGVGGWASTLELTGAVIAPGQLVVDTNVKKVQHPTGGIVGELLVRNSDRVKAGDLLVRFDDTVTAANLAIVNKGLDQLIARLARLEAERDGADTIRFSDELIARRSDPDVERVLTGEQKLFDFRKSSRTGQKAQLNERISQLQEEIVGLTEQAAAKAKEVELINRELEGVRDLWSKNLISITRLSALERDAVRLSGERGQLIAATAQSKGKIAEIQLQIIQIDQDLRTEVSREIREIQSKAAELVERKVQAEDQLKRIEIRSPQDGMVHQMTVFTVGGVVNQGETLMLIVPEGEELLIEAKVAPQDIDQVRIGQRAVLRFSAFNQRTTPEVLGEVSLVSADLIADQRTGLSHYTVRIRLANEQVARLGERKLIPGMPVEAFIETDQRTIFSYLVKPATDQIYRSFRER